jgi:hypothetical protein
MKSVSINHKRTKTILVFAGLVMCLLLWSGKAFAGYHSNSYTVASTFDASNQTTVNLDLKGAGFDPSTEEITKNSLYVCFYSKNLKPFDYNVDIGDNSYDVHGRLIKIVRFQNIEIASLNLDGILSFEISPLSDYKDESIYSSILLTARAIPVPAPVPIPSSVILLGTGLGITIFLMRKKSQDDVQYCKAS